MSTSDAKPCQVVNVRPLGTELSRAKTTTLLKTNAMQLIRLIVPAGKEISSHEASGEVLVQCLEGRVGFTAGGKTHELSAGQLLYLSCGEPHSLRGIENSSLLVTILSSKSMPEFDAPHFDAPQFDVPQFDVPQFDVVEEASEESFPASDPPANW